MKRLNKTGQLDYIINLQKQLQDYKYGVLKNGRIQGMSSAKEWNKYYRYLSPEEFEKYHGGACWDYVAYQTEKLAKEGIDFNNYYLEFLDDPDHGSHTITICKVGNNYVYIEASFKSIAGVYISNSIDNILDFVLTEMYKLKNGAFSKRHIVRKYKHTIKYGIDCQTFMGYIYKKEIVRDNAETFTDKNIKPLYVPKKSLI